METQKDTAYYAITEQSRLTLDLVRERITEMINCLVKFHKDPPKAQVDLLTKRGGLIDQAINYLGTHPIQLEKLEGGVREFAFNLFEVNHRIITSATVQKTIKKEKWDIKEVKQTWLSEYETISKQRFFKKLQKSYVKFAADSNIGLAALDRPLASMFATCFSKRVLPLNLLIRLMGSEILPAKDRMLLFIILWEQRDELN